MTYEGPRHETLKLTASHETSLRLAYLKGPHPYPPSSFRPIIEAPLRSTGLIATVVHYKLCEDLQGTGVSAFGAGSFRFSSCGLFQEKSTEDVINTYTFKPVICENLRYTHGRRSGLPIFASSWILRPVEYNGFWELPPTIRGA